MRNLTALALATGGLAFASPAQAVLLQYDLTGDYSASWQLDSDPVPGEFVAGLLFRLDNVPGDFPGSVSNIVNVFFLSGDFGGGLGLTDELGGGGFLVDTTGSQLYSGSEADPTLLTGVFPLSEFAGEGSYTLTVTTVAGVIPEPATWGMMLLGFGFVGGAMRARRRHTRLAVTYAA